MFQSPGRDSPGHDSTASSAASTSRNSTTSIGKYILLYVLVHASDRVPPLCTVLGQSIFTDRAFGILRQLHLVCVSTIYCKIFFFFFSAVSPQFQLLGSKDLILA